MARSADPPARTVEDEGPGLPDTSNLFVPFFTTKPSGSGIGLALSRQIAEAHGGTLTPAAIAFPFSLLPYPLLLSPTCAAGLPFLFWFSRSRRF